MRTISFLLVAFSLSLSACGGPEPLRLLNVSYDPTRELYQAVNQAFATRWKAQTGQDLRIQQSHGGSAKQARAILDGLPADVATLALPLDIDALAEGGLVPSDWRQRLPQQSSPFYSTIVFVVRPGNPKQIHDWPDLIRPGVQVICANPKTSGGARCAYMAAWAWGKEAYVRALFAQVPVLDSGSRAASGTFVARGIGDVLLTWENEAFLAQHESPDSGLEVVYPSQSLQIDLPVAVVSSVTQADGHDALAQAYLKFLFSPQGQALAAAHGFRPRDPKVAVKFKAKFPSLKLLSIQSVAGSWQQAQAEQFAAGARFDRLLGERR